jgi:hypothetical protein
MPPGELEPARQFFQRLTRLAIEAWNLTPEFSIQVNCLHLGDGATRIQNNGRAWIPMIGLGIWPGRQAPTMWTDADFRELGIGEKPRELMYQLLRVTTTADAREQAQSTMFGLGTGLQILLPMANDEFISRARSFCLAGIQDPVFTCYPFYLPLLDIASLSNRSSSELDLWSCGLTVYLRESLEDKGVIVASRQSLVPLFEKLGGRAQAAPDPGWVFPG